MPRWVGPKRVHGHMFTHTIRQIRDDLFTLHSPSHLDLHGRIIGTARTLEGARAALERFREAQP